MDTPLDNKAIKILSSTPLFKVMNSTQYKNGLNVLSENLRFYYPRILGGTSFVKVQNFTHLLADGVDLRVVRLDEMRKQPNFQIIRSGLIYISNVIHLENSMPLSKPSTYEFLKDAGLQINTDSNLHHIFLHAVKHGFLSIIQYLYETFGPDAIRNRLTHYNLIQIVKSGHSKIYDWIFNLFPIQIRILWKELNLSSRGLVDDIRFIGKDNAFLIKKLSREGLISFSEIKAWKEILFQGNVELFLHLAGDSYRFEPNSESDFSFMVNLVQRNHPSIFHEKGICLKVGIDINRVEYEMLTHCISLAIHHENMPMAEYLIEKASEKSPDDFHICNFMVLTASKKNHINLVNSFLQKLGRDHPYFFDLFTSAVEIAFNYNCHEVIEFFVKEYGSEPDLMNVVFGHAIRTAFNSLPMVKILMERGIDYRSYSESIFEKIIVNPFIHFPDIDIEFFAKYEGIITEEFITKYCSNDSFRREELRLYVVGSMIQNQSKL